MEQSNTIKISRGGKTFYYIDSVKEILKAQPTCEIHAIGQAMKNSIMLIESLKKFGYVEVLKTEIHSIILDQMEGRGNGKVTRSKLLIIVGKSPQFDQKVTEYETFRGTKNPKEEEKK